MNESARRQPQKEKPDESHTFPHETHTFRDCTYGRGEHRRIRSRTGAHIDNDAVRRADGDNAG